MPEGYSREIDEHPEEVSPDEIKHGEDVHEDWKEVEKKQESNWDFQQKKKLREETLESLKFEFPSWEKIKVKEELIPQYDEFVKEVGKDIIERILNDDNLSLDDKKRILGSLNSDLKRGIVSRIQFKENRYHSSLDNPDPVVLEKEMDSAKYRKDNVKVESIRNMIEGMLINDLVSESLDDYLRVLLRCLANLAKKKSYEDVMLEKIKYFEKDNVRRGGFSALIKEELGYNWDEESGHYVRVGEGKK